MRAGCGSNGPNVVSPLTSHCTTPGSSTLPAGKVVPRITRLTWRASASSLPTPFMTEATAPSAKTCAVAAIADSACIALVATMPSSQGGSAAGSLVACSRPCTSPAPDSRRPRSLIASTCACERSKAHTSTSSSVARLAANSDPTAPQPTMQILMSVPSGVAAGVAAGRRTRGSENSRPPVMPDGLRISIVAMTAPRMMSVVPCGRSILTPTSMPVSAWLRKESRPLTTSAPSTAPQRLVAPPKTSIASVRNVSSR